MQNSEEDNMKKEILDTLVCQQCLGNLSFDRSNLVCSNCKTVYPISNGLIFMGYAKNREIEIKKIIQTERDHQTNLEEMQKHYDFAYPSFKHGLLSINILAHDTKENSPIAIDIGCGGAPMSKMLCEKGFDTYCCELDPNSLFAGFQWKHPNLGLGKYVVCDSSILPFPSNSIDAVYCKEFVHHIEDYKSIFSEVNRVLKKGGIFLMIEPTSTFPLFLQNRVNDNHYGHHYQTIFNYYSALKKNGFLPYRYYVLLSGKNKRQRLINMFTFNKLINCLNQQIFSKPKTSRIGLILKMFIQKLAGGSNFIFSKKIRNVSNYIERPKIQIVEPSELILTEEYLTDPRLDKFNEILNDVYEEILHFA
jgi:ubiquinone/menaquinone biosynthesis C-methylase UbiE/uncharacterized protein YbaR (Trm112 family)